MEKKTIGRFIATLRKANGMTQKELAEKLNVSDKTVSRWERDESAPDLTLIPVIAEIFGVTSDELLRGEKKPLDAMEDTSDKLSAKSEKQIKNMVNQVKTKLQVRSILSIGIALIGLLVSVILNSELGRAKLAFLVGIVFIAVALICESIFYSMSFASIRECEWDSRLLLDCRFSLLKRLEKTLSCIIVLFAAMTPLFWGTGLQMASGDIIHWDLYIGDRFWLKYGVISALITLIACWCVCSVVNRRFMNKNQELLLEEERMTSKKHTQRMICFWVFAVIFVLVTACVQSFINIHAKTNWFSDGILFDNYEDFVTFMERSEPDATEGDETTAVIEEDEDSEYVMEKEKLLAEDGTVLCSYYWNNMSVMQIDYGGETDGYLPIEVFTKEHIDMYWFWKHAINAAFAILYILEVVSLYVCIVKKKK